jgi:hypothetical protein
MDLEKFLEETDLQVSQLKSEMFEARQLLKYAFKEDIIQEKKSVSPSPNSKKRYSPINRL